MTQRRYEVLQSVVLPGWGQFTQQRRSAGWAFLVAGLAVVMILALREPLGVPSVLAWLDLALVTALSAWDAGRATVARPGRQ